MPDEENDKTRDIENESSTIDREVLDAIREENSKAAGAVRRTPKPNATNGS